MDALARNWWLIVLRGGLAAVFGLAVLLWRDLTLGLLVIAFGSYAILDGLAALASALRASTKPAEGWPVTSEGLVSLIFGGLAFVWPLVPRDALHVIAGWGVLTGILELLAAARLPRVRASHWFLALGGLSSLLLAGLLLAVPHGERRSVMDVIGIYALVFGALLALTGSRVRDASEPPGSHEFATAKR
jgi:uncharacterized membrane protein HdeD (DUF308 family)